MAKFKFNEKVEVVNGFYIGYIGKVVSHKPGLFADMYYVEFENESINDQLLYSSDLTSIDNGVFSEKLEKIVSEEDE